MFDFEKALVSDIPLHEASAFFIGIKTASPREEVKEIVFSDEAVKTAALRMKSAAQRVIDDLLAGKMPEGKAGHFKTAGVKLAFGEPMLQDQAAQQAPEQVAVEPVSGQPQGPNPGTPSMTTEPHAGQMPTNYLGAELAAQRAQQQNEVGFYRERMLKAVAENQALQEQIAGTQSELQQLQQQAAMTGTQIQLATQQAVQAQDSALQQSMLAAKMRMGMQQMRAQMLQIASQDPAAIAEQDALAAGAAAAGMGGPGAPQPANTAGYAPEGAPQAGQPGSDGAAAPGQPGAAGGQSEASGAPAAGASGEGGAPAAEKKPESKSSSSSSDKPKPKPKTEVSIKTAGIATVSQLKEHGLGLGAGAALGAGLKLIKGERQDSLSEKVKKLEGKDTSYRGALRLSKAKADLDDAKASKKYPVGAAVRGAAIGGALGTAASKVIKKVHSLK